MSAYEMREPKRAWRQGLGSKVGKCDSPNANFNGHSIQKQADGISAKNCPRFDFCNCPVCPLDTNWQSQRHLSGEPVCRWLREAVKSGSEPVLKRALPDELVAHVIAVANSLITRKGSLKSSLERAASSKSKSQVIAPWQKLKNG
jgi:hypothetical protein